MEEAKGFVVLGNPKSKGDGDVLLGSPTWKGGGAVALGSPKWKGLGIVVLGSPNWSSERIVVLGSKRGVCGQQNEPKGSREGGKEGRRRDEGAKKENGGNLSCDRGGVHGLLRLCRSLKA